MRGHSFYPDPEVWARMPTADDPRAQGRDAIVFAHYESPEYLLWVTGADDSGRVIGFHRPKVPGEGRSGWFWVSSEDLEHPRGPSGPFLERDVGWVVQPVWAVSSIVAVGGAE